MKLKQTIAVTAASALLFTVGCSAIGLSSKNCSPYYGNWCGKDYPQVRSGEHGPPAVDEWDAACRRHDRCYASGTDKDECDLDFVVELEVLSTEQLVPDRMRGAHSWFRKDGFVAGNLRWADMSWSRKASCRGGDGRAAEFSCRVGYYDCPLDKNYGGGSRAGMPCHCDGWLGVIVET